MGSYHQMGHHSENLLTLPELSGYEGAIISPVNYSEAEVIEQIKLVDDRSFRFLFDPQLYCPQTERDKLREWSYFPNDVETADLSDIRWWNALTDQLLLTIGKLDTCCVCSPAMAPNTYSTEYYTLSIDVCNYLYDRIENPEEKVYQTLVADLSDLAVSKNMNEIASIASRTKAKKIYMIFVNNTTPRRELANTDELKGAMKLISLLENAGLEVLVGFCSSDVLLWKAAGASSCATGKYFNLRRYTSSRFDEPTASGGGQLPYWLEESLVAFLRESDVVRLQNAGLIQDASNPFSAEIITKIETGAAWLGLSWRHYLFAFADIENRLSTGELNCSELLKQAEAKWISIEDKSIFMEEARNDGSWIRAWRRALIEYDAL